MASPNASRKTARTDHGFLNSAPKQDDMWPHYEECDRHQQWLPVQPALTAGEAHGSDDNALVTGRASLVGYHDGFHYQ
jgi:hypothetical protein